MLHPGNRAEEIYNQAHIRTRNSIERLIGVWKRRFPILAYGFRCKLENVMTCIVATAVLHNIAVAMREELPPLPEDMNIDLLNYLIDQGHVPDIPQNIAIYGPGYNFRDQMIRFYFGNL